MIGKTEKIGRQLSEEERISPGTLWNAGKNRPPLRLPMPCGWCIAPGWAMPRRWRLRLALERLRPSQKQKDPAASKSKII